MGGGGGNRGIMNLPLPPVTQGEEGSSEEGEEGGRSRQSPHHLNLGVLLPPLVPRSSLSLGLISMRDFYGGLHCIIFVDRILVCFLLLI